LTEMPAGAGTELHALLNRVLARRLGVTDRPD
jgi:hypothetical protein